MKTIIETHKDLVSGEITSESLVESCFKEADQQNESHFVSKCKETALERAKEADRKIQSKKAGLLCGIPFSLKDLFITKGVRTTGGSRILLEYIPEYDGHVSEKLKESDAVLVGKVSCDEFGMGSTNENTPFPKFYHPQNNSYVCGGSSGGCAASVLTNTSLFSVGTDTGGSIRLPANFCGLYSMKPSYGAVSRYGQLAYGSSLDQAGPMGRSPLDLAIVLEKLTIPDKRDSTQTGKRSFDVVEKMLQADVKNLKGKKIGYDPKLLDGCREDVKLVLKETLESLKSLGVEIKEVSFDYSQAVVATYYIIATSEASSNLSRYDGMKFGYRNREEETLEEIYKKTRSLGFGKEVKKRVALGTFCLSSGYYDAYYEKACKVRRLIKNNFDSIFSEVDFYFSPVSSTTAFKKDEAEKDPLFAYLNDIFTIPANLAGLPSLAYPTGTGIDDMPTGFQLMSKRENDEELLMTAEEIFRSGALK